MRNGGQEETGPQTLAKLLSAKAGHAKLSDVALYLRGQTQTGLNPLPKGIVNSFYLNFTLLELPGHSHFTDMETEAQRLKGTTEAEPWQHAPVAIL